MAFSNNRSNQYGGFTSAYDVDCSCKDRASWLYGGTYKGQIVSNCGGAKRWICLHEHETRDEAMDCAELALQERRQHDKAYRKSTRPAAGG